MPVLNFSKLNRPDLNTLNKNKIENKINKSIKVSSSGRIVHYSLSNRDPDELISFSMNNEHEESNTATMNKASMEIVADEAQVIFHEKNGNGCQILIKDVNNASSNLFDSRQHESNMSKAYNSWFANSSNTTKKKVYSKTNNKVDYPILQASFDKSECKPFSPFQSSESTLKRQQCKKQFTSTNENLIKSKILNLNSKEIMSMHDDLMEIED